MIRFAITLFVLALSYPAFANLPDPDTISAKVPAHTADRQDDAKILRGSADLPIRHRAPAQSTFA